MGEVIKLDNAPLSAGEIAILRRMQDALEANINTLPDSAKRTNMLARINRLRQELEQEEARACRLKN